MSETLRMDYDSLREKEVLEFFYLLRQHEAKLKEKKPIASQSWLD